MLLKPFVRGAACTFAATSLLLSAMVPASAAQLRPKTFSPFPGDELEVTCINESEYNTPGDYQDKVIAWAECTGLITHGRRLYLQKNKNAPQPAMTRGQLLEFLYHLKGRPVVKDLPATSPYSDISANDPHYPIAIWATREGISSGWGDGKFHYNDIAYTDTALIFLYRMHGKPTVNLTPIPEEYAHCVKENSDMHKARSWYGSPDMSCGYNTEDEVTFSSILYTLYHLDLNGIY